MMPDSLSVYRLQPNGDRAARRPGCGCCVHCQCTGRCVDTDQPISSPSSPAEQQERTPVAMQHSHSYNTLTSAQSSDPLSPLSSPKLENQRLLSAIANLPHPNDTIYGRKSKMSMPDTSSQALTPQFGPVHHATPAMTRNASTLSTGAASSTARSLPGSSPQTRNHSRKSPSSNNLIGEAGGMSASAMVAGAIDGMGMGAGVGSMEGELAARNRNPSRKNNFSSNDLHATPPNGKKANDSHHSSRNVSRQQSPERESPTASKPGKKRDASRKKPIEEDDASTASKPGKARSASRKKPIEDDDDDDDDDESERRHAEEKRKKNPTSVAKRKNSMSAGHHSRHPSISGEKADEASKTDTEKSLPMPPKLARMRSKSSHGPEHVIAASTPVEIRTWAPTPTLGTFNHPKTRDQTSSSSDDDDGEEEERQRQRRHAERKKHREEEKKAAAAKLAKEIEEKEREKRRQRKLQKEQEKAKAEAAAVAARERKRRDSDSDSDGSESDDEEEELSRTSKKAAKSSKSDKKSRSEHRSKSRKAPSDSDEESAEEKAEKQRRMHQKADKIAGALAQQSKQHARAASDDDDSSDAQVKASAPVSGTATPSSMSRSAMTHSPADSHSRSRAPSPDMQRSISIAGFTLTRKRSLKMARDHGKAQKEQDEADERSAAEAQMRGDDRDPNDSKRDRLKTYIDTVVSKTLNGNGNVAKSASSNTLNIGGVQGIRHGRGASPMLSASNSVASGLDANVSSKLNSLHATRKLLVQAAPPPYVNTLHFVDMSRMESDGSPFVAFRLISGPGLEEYDLERKKHGGHKEWLIDSHENGAKVKGQLLFAVGREGPVLFSIDVKRRNVDKFVIQGATNGPLGSYSDALHWGEHEDYRHVYCQSPDGRSLKWFMQEPGKLMRLFGRGEQDHGQVYAEARMTVPPAQQHRKRRKEVGGGSKEATLLFYHPDALSESQDDDGMQGSAINLAYQCATWWVARQTWDEGKVAAAHAEIKMIEMVEKAFEVDMLAGA